MKRFALMLVLAGGVLLAASAAFADHVGIYSDQQGNSCTTASLVSPPAVNYSYVVHKYTVGSNGSRWKIVDSSGLFQASASSPYAVLGEPYTGASVAYGNCLNGTIVAYTLGHLWFGQPVTCGKMEVVPDPLESAGTVIYSDCNFVKQVASAGQFFWNANGTCQECNDPNPTAPATWGTIKALYR
jgi:hypothetical protein